MRCATLGNISPVSQQRPLWRPRQRIELRKARFFHVTLPMIQGPLLIGLMITTIFSFRTIDLIIPLTAGGPGRATYVLGYYIWDQITKSLNFGLGAAAGVVLFLLTSLITLIFVYLLRDK
jgi:multiple sugar transport system permease protein